MGTNKKIIIVLILLIGIFTLRVNQNFCQAWTDEEWDEFEDWADDYGIDYNEYDDADDFLSDNGYDSVDDYWEDQGYDNADDFWDSYEIYHDAAYSDWTSQYESATINAVGEYFYLKSDGTYDVDSNNDGIIDKVGLVDSNGAWAFVDYYVYYSNPVFYSGDANYMGDTKLNGALLMAAEPSSNFLNTFTTAAGVTTAIASLAEKSLSIAYTAYGLIITVESYTFALDQSRVSQEYYDFLQNYFDSSNNEDNGVFVEYVNVTASGGGCFRTNYYSAKTGELIGSVNQCY